MQLTLVTGVSGNEEVENDLPNRDTPQLPLERNDVEESQHGQEERHFERLHVARHPETAPRVTNAVACQYLEGKVDNYSETYA